MIAVHTFADGTAEVWKGDRVLRNYNFAWLRPCCAGESYVRFRTAYSAEAAARAMRNHEACTTIMEIPEVDAVLDKEDAQRRAQAYCKWALTVTTAFAILCFVVAASLVVAAVPVHP